VSAIIIRSSAKASTVTPKISFSPTTKSLMYTLNRQHEVEYPCGTPQFTNVT